MTGGAYLVTGAGSGIGRAVASVLDRAGARQLVLVDRDAEALQETAAEVTQSRLVCASMDVADPAGWAALDLDEPLSGAVICAGVSRAGLIVDMAFDDWRGVVSANLDGAFLSLKTALTHARDGASIVAVSSATAHKAVPMTAAYGASKAGLSQLVKVAALEAAPRKIRVNAIAPGGVKTPMFSDQAFFEGLVAEHRSEAGAWAALGEAVPLGRYAEPDEIAQMIMFLLGEDSATMTGAVLACDGGYSV